MKYLVALALAALAYVVWVVVFRNRRAGGYDWEAVASEAGLTFFAGGELQCPVMRGRCHGVDVRVTSEDGELWGVADRITRVVGFFEAPLPAGLFVARHGSLGALERIFEIERFELGDPDFDSMLLIKGTDEEEVIRLLSDRKTRSELEDFFEKHPRAQVTQTTVTMILPFVVDSRSELDLVLDDLVGVIDLFTEAALQDEVDELMEGRRSSIPTQTPEVRYSEAPLSSMFADDMSLKGAVRDGEGERGGDARHDPAVDELQDEPRHSEQTDVEHD